MNELSKTNLSSALMGDIRDHRKSTDIPSEGLKMWLLVRKDLPMSLGKLAIQSGHAFSTCLLIAHGRSQEIVNMYLGDAQPKIAVRVKSIDEMATCIGLCNDIGIPTAIVTDAARTEFKEPTVTVAAIGPCLRSDLPKKVQRLQMFKDFVDTSAENEV